MSEAEDVARSREFLRQGVGTTTRRNRVLPAARLPSPIPARVGKAGPREEVGTYVEVDYALRVLETDNSMTYHYDMLNTPLDGNMRLYLQPRPRDTTAGDANYYASAVKLTTTDGLLKTDYQLTLQEAMIRPASGADRVAGFGAAPVTDWFSDRDLIRGPTGVHALVKKPRKVDMLVDGTPETLTLKPPPYTSPAGNGLCVLDEILKLGDPWHGLIQGGTVRLPGGKTRPVARPGIGVGVVYPLIPYGVTPAATADAADVAAGRTWLNYGLVAGQCLYEQRLTNSSETAFVYIAPGNSTWRVIAAYYSLLGVPGLRLQFYPLRKRFMTTDTWGGLAQTIEVPCNPVPPSYTVGDLYDLDSKGANAIFVKLNPDQTIVKGAALLNIQGIPPAATATYTLVIDSQYTSGLYSPTNPAKTLDYSRVTTWRNEWFNAWTNEYYEQNMLLGDPAPFDMGSGTPTGWQWMFHEVDGIFNGAGIIVGFCFDENDTLQTVEMAYEIELRFTESPNQALNIRDRTITGPNSQGYQMFCGNIRSSFVSWTVSSYSGPLGDIPVFEDNQYGPLEDAYLFPKRYSNRLWGMGMSYPGGNTVWFPPLSPDTLSAYPAPIVTSGSHPFGTYHPITQEIAWETGFVNFV